MAEPLRMPALRALLDDARAVRWHGHACRKGIDTRLQQPVQGVRLQHVSSSWPANG